METQYQRSTIQEESLYYERLKHSGEYPIVGVNTYLNPEQDNNAVISTAALTRATTEEKQAQIANLKAFHQKHAQTAPIALEKLKKAALNHENIFDVLLETTRVASLGQITEALSQVGGEYRRSL
jgi:methylmalonyl-CoA mutase